MKKKLLDAAVGAFDLNLRGLILYAYDFIFRLEKSIIKILELIPRLRGKPRRVRSDEI